MSTVSKKILDICLSANLEKHIFPAGVRKDCSCHTADRANLIFLFSHSDHHRKIMAMPSMMLKKASFIVVIWLKVIPEMSTKLSDSQNKIEIIIDCNVLRML